MSAPVTTSARTWSQRGFAVISGFESATLTFDI